MQQVVPDGKDTVKVDVAAAGNDQRTVGDVPQEEQPHGGKQQGACQHEEAGVAEGEFEPNAQPGRSPMSIR